MFHRATIFRQKIECYNIFKDKCKKLHKSWNLSKTNCFLKAQHKWIAWKVNLQVLLKIILNIFMEEPFGKKLSKYVASHVYRITDISYCL